MGGFSDEDAGARIPRPINMPSQRLETHVLSHNTESLPKGTATWVNKPMPPASNAWGLPSLLYPKNDGETGSFSHINDHPSSRGSSTTSSAVGSDFLDSPSAWGPDSCPFSASAVLRSHHLPTATDRLRSTETGSGSSQLSRFPTEVLKAPLETIGKRGPTSDGKGFTLSMDDFPILGSSNSVKQSASYRPWSARATNIWFW